MIKEKSVRSVRHIAAKCLISAMLLLAAPGVFAQVQRSFCSFDRLSVGVNGGTMGVGIEFSTPLSSWARARVGASFMPNFTIPMTFGISSYVSGEGVQPITNKFDNINAILKNFTGMTINENVDMNATASMSNVSMIFDFYPLRNKHFYISAGFYWGKRKIGHIENNIREMPTLMGLQVYNNLYDYFMSERYIDEPLYNDVYLDPEVGDQLRDRFAGYGVVGVHIGDYKSDGQPYLMEPDKDGVIEADMFVNSFKPYVGLGYECDLSHDHRWSFGVNAGMWIWGGTPDIITHDGVNMVKDLDNIRGKIGTYVDIASKFIVYPAVNITLSYNISMPKKTRPNTET